MTKLLHGPRSPFTTHGSGRTVSWLLDWRAGARGDRTFFVWEPFDAAPATWTYGRFAETVARVAGGLRERGVKPGDSVLIHLENRPEFLLAWFACARLGAVAVCTNTRSAPDEVAYYVDHSDIVLAITQPSLAQAVAAALPAAAPLFVTVEAGERPGHAEAFDRLLQADPVAAAPVSDLTAAGIQYTSGSTGRPKAVVWTHANCLWGAKVNAAHEGLVEDDVQLVFAPLFHTNAQAYSVLASLWAGSSFVLQPKFSSSRYWDASVRNRCTFGSHLYFTLRALSGIEPPEDHSYRLWGTGMSGHPVATRLGVRTIGWWGMTETISHPIIGDIQTPDTPGTIGRPAPEYEIAVLRDDGDPVEPGETGDLLVRGTAGVSIFAGYLHDEAATAAAFDEQGWFRSGDRVTVHPDGCISFADRTKDMLKIAGENVAASEIERVVASVSGVAEVAVVGAPDPMRDEAPVAFVVMRKGHGDPVAAVLAACREKLADFKVPREVRVVSELPRATLEKVAKHKLRDILREEAASEKAAVDGA
jgi:crotonobetaine/carnitine-CoA ligase